MAGTVSVRVEGLRELRRDLRRAGAEFPRELSRTNKRVVERIVVPEAQRRGRQTRTNLAGNPTRLGSRGVASIRALASATRAEVAMGGARIPYASGHEFGSGRYRQFPPKRREGYILLPAVEATHDEILDAYRAMLDELARRAFSE